MVSQVTALAKYVFGYRGGGEEVSARSGFSSDVGNGGIRRRVWNCVESREPCTRPVQLGARGMPREVGMSTQDPSSRAARSGRGKSNLLTRRS